MPVGTALLQNFVELVTVAVNLIALGISHNSAAVEVRERVAFAPEQVGEALVDACELRGRSWPR